MDTNTLIRRAQSGDREAEEALLRQYQPLVYKMAHRACKRSLSEDVVQEGRLGLLRAIREFDPSKGVNFSTFAALNIKVRMLKWFQDKEETIRIPRYLFDRGLAEEARMERVSLSSYDDEGELVGEREDIPDLSLPFEEWVSFCDAFGKLSPVERKALFDNRVKGVAGEKIATELGFSQSKAANILHVATDKLKAAYL